MSNEEFSTPKGEILAGPKRPLSLIFAVLFSLLIGGLALFLAYQGFQGRGGRADQMLVGPNLVTGVTSVIGALGYFWLRKWSIGVYAITVLGHFTGHSLLLGSHASGGRVSIFGVISLLIVPLISLGILVLMIRHRRVGLLK